MKEDVELEGLIAQFKASIKGVPEAEQWFRMFYDVCLQQGEAASGDAELDMAWSFNAGAHAMLTFLKVKLLESNCSGADLVRTLKWLNRAFHSRREELQRRRRRYGGLDG